MELLFLGTGAGVPAKARNVSALAFKLLAERGTVWLFDCGEGTQHQILRTSLKPRKIEKIFITHLHGDHIFGLPGLLGSRSFQAGETPLTVYGPKGIADFLRISLEVSETRLRYPLIIEEIEEGIVFEDEQMMVEARLLEHGIPSYGYRIIEKDRPGVLLVDKLKEMGIMPGPLYKKIKNGETVVLGDGRVIDGKEFVGPSKKGKVVAILGDTRPCQSAVELAKDADMLVHEGTFSAESAEMAFEYFHSTTAQAAEIAKKANAKALCLNHVSSRYPAEEWDRLQKEAESIFQPTVLVHDFMEVKIEDKEKKEG